MVSINRIVGMIKAYNKRGHIAINTGRGIGIFIFIRLLKKPKKLPKIGMTLAKVILLKIHEIIGKIFAINSKNDFIVPKTFNIEVFTYIISVNKP